MERLNDSNPRKQALTVQLAQSDFDILERFRGDLSPDAFVSALLRMVDSGTVVSTPEWLNDTGNK